MVTTTAANAAAEREDGNPSKRRCIKVVLGGMESLVNDCLLEILRCSSPKDLNSIAMAMCSRRYREARSNPLLDQTRTGTIVFRTYVCFLSPVQYL
jgi:hypothetical protein